MQALPSRGGKALELIALPERARWPATAAQVLPGPPCGRGGGPRIKEEDTEVQQRGQHHVASKKEPQTESGYNPALCYCNIQISWILPKFPVDLPVLENKLLIFR